MNGDPTQHYVINAILFILMIVRYLTGPLGDLLRLGLVISTGYGVASNLDAYYAWKLEMPHFGQTQAAFIVKIMLASFIIADLVKDYFAWRYDQWRRELVSFVEKSK